MKHNLKLFIPLLVLSFLFIHCGRGRGIGSSRNGSGDGFGDDLFGDGNGSGNGKTYGTSTSGLKSLGGNGISGNGTGNVNGNGEGNYKGSLGDVTSLFLKGMNAEGPGLNNSALPFKFKFSGPTKIQNFLCYPYDLSVVNVNGFVTPLRPGDEIQAILSDDGKLDGANPSAGAFFARRNSDGSCDGGLGSVTFKAFEHTKKMYYMNAIATAPGYARVLKADGHFLGYPFIGRLAINIENDPSKEAPAVMSYEDWVNGDSDYNDVVLRRKKTGNSPFIYVSANGKSFTAAGSGATEWEFKQGTSACRTRTTVSVTHSDGSKGDVYVQEDSRVPSTFRLNVRFLSQISVEFMTYDWCSTGAPVSPPHDRVCLMNFERGPADESQHFTCPTQ